jgi:hypothetical protein
VLAQAQGVGMPLGGRVARAGLELDLLLELDLVDGRVALHVDARHDRVLGDLDDKARAPPLDAHFREQPRGEQRLDGLIGLGCVVGASLSQLEMRAHRVRPDGAVAGDLDGGDRVRCLQPR